MRSSRGAPIPGSISSIRARRVIPSPHEGDSRGGFPKRGGCDSPWQTGGSLPWLLRLGFEGITTPRDCASWRSGLRMPIRRGACAAADSVFAYTHTPIFVHGPSTKGLDVQVLVGA